MSKRRKYSFGVSFQCCAIVINASFLASTMSLPLNVLYSHEYNWSNVDTEPGLVLYAVRNANYALPFKHVLLSHENIVRLSFFVVS